MKAPDIQRFLQMLGAHKIRMGGQWVKSACPFAPYYHQKGEDKSPSFGIKIADGASGYSCLACHRRGDLHQLLWALEAKGRSFYGSGGVNFDALHEFVRTHNSPNLTDLANRVEGATTGWDKVKAKPVGPQMPLVPAQEPDPLSEDVMKKFIMPAGAGLDWLRVKKPAVTVKTLDVWEVKWQPQAERIAIPIRDQQGRLVGVSGRAVHEESKPGAEVCPCGEIHPYGQKPKFLHSNGFKRDFYLYGEQFLKKDKSTFGVLTEGFFDVQFLWQNKYNSFAIMGSYLSDLQIEKCFNWFTEVLIFPDNDKAGLEGARANEAALKRRGLPCRILVPREGKIDPDDHTPDDFLELLGAPNL